MTFIRKYKRGNKVYLAEVEGHRVGGKVIQRFVRYVGKEADGRMILSTSISNSEVKEVKLYGPLLVLHCLAEGIGLREHLGGYANEILSIVYATHHNVSNAGQVTVNPSFKPCCEEADYSNFDFKSSWDSPEGGFGGFDSHAPPPLSSSCS